MMFMEGVFDAWLCVDVSFEITAYCGVATLWRLSTRETLAHGTASVFPTDGELGRGHW